MEVVEHLMDKVEDSIEIVEDFKAVETYQNEEVQEEFIFQSFIRISFCPYFKLECFIIFCMNFI